MVERICRSCFHFAAPSGLCKRFPAAVSKADTDTCGEFKLLHIDPEILSTHNSALGWFSAHSLAALRRNNIRNISDILDLGRVAIKDAGGHLDREAIKDISSRLAEAGIEW